MNSFRNSKGLSVLTIALLIVNIATLILLWKNHQRDLSDRPPGGPVFVFVVKELGLNDQQQAQYKTLREEHHLLQQPLQDSIRRAKDAFFDLLKDSTANNEKVDWYNKKAIALQEQLELINFRHFQKLRAICDSRQQQKFDGILQTVIRRIGAARHPGNRPEPGPAVDNYPPPPGAEHGPPADKEGLHRPPPPNE